MSSGFTTSVASTRPACRAARRGQATSAPPRPTATPPRQHPTRHPPLRRFTPRRGFGLATLATTLILSAGLLIVAPGAPLLAWTLAVNGVALLAFGYDKGVAGSDRLRVPEVVLLGLALAGGSLGALLGMLLFRHKTSKRPFLVSFWLVVALQLALVIGWLLLNSA